MIRTLLSLAGALSCLLLINPAFSQDSIPSNNKPVIKIGGALRFNYNLSDWKKEQVKRGGDFGFDMFRINADASWKKLSLHAEYRFYSKDFGGGMLKEGYVRYHFNDSLFLDLGLHQVPFGNQTYNSHSWFFNLPYYAGLEDDYDMGIKLVKRSRNWLHQLAFYKNAEELSFGDKSAIDPGRYSYDLAGRNKEVNQGNIRSAYFFNDRNSIGASAMLGGIYNIPTGNMGHHWAIALHTDLGYRKWNLKLQSLYYERHAADSAQYRKQLEMGAYGATYQVAARGFIHTTSLSYTQPVTWGPISTLTFYENYSYMHKPENGFTDTQMNVLGCMLTAGHIYTYVDWAAGYNQPWLGPLWNTALAAGDANANWHSRFNINIGYYF
ncbi:OprO/OprP family phosphate-selective porin [Chitinophaga pendula]|uniref:porin n=1 Tax=Chitinophaga TaxID=79328 RepID=UPI0018DEFEF1|nr:MULTISPECIES: porin [Chitinophaga]UCJ08747.1 OprO/OprP family phosphate-selective porin [Chitinophaga pendula]